MILQPNIILYIHVTISNSAHVTITNSGFTLIKIEILIGAKSLWILNLSKWKNWMIMLYFERQEDFLCKTYDINIIFICIAER
jgi:hypothetical protein